MRALTLFQAITVILLHRLLLLTTLVYIKAKQPECGNQCGNITVWGGGRTPEPAGRR